MIQVQFPAPDFKLKKENGLEYIFDVIRKQWLVLTEEEWVRQNFIQYLVQTHEYPMAYIAIEKEIRLGELKKRFDILVYDRQHLPWMMIECKAPTVPLGETVLQQVLRYHISIPVPFLTITNGQFTYAWGKLGNDLASLATMPIW